MLLRAQKALDFNNSRSTHVPAFALPLFPFLATGSPHLQRVQSHPVNLPRLGVVVDHYCFNVIAFLSQPQDAPGWMGDVKVLASVKGGDRPGKKPFEKAKLLRLG